MRTSIRCKSAITFALLACVISTLLFIPDIAQGQAEQYRGQGKDQLVRALDAAIARLIDSGQYRIIINSDPVAGPLMVNIADCYPRITEDSVEIYPFPNPPTGVLATIINSRQVRVGFYDAAGAPGSFNIFNTVNANLMRAIIDELGKGYGIPPSPDPGAIQILQVNIFPPSSSTFFTRLNNGDFDISDLLGALGATANKKRRRTQARFTCTVFGTPWYMHVRNDSSYQTFDDVLADPDAVMCVGLLSSRLSEDYFKNATIVNKMLSDDISECSAGVRDGIYDAYLHFDPVPVSYPSPNDLRSIPMNLVSGVPLWIAGENSCEGLDVCEGNFSTDPKDTDVDGSDAALFKSDFNRSSFENPCPNCVQGW